MYIFLALFAYVLAAHITTEAWCEGGGVCTGTAPFIVTNVELGECYVHCNPCASTSTCTNQMFSNDQGSNLIYQYIFNPTTADAEPNCDNEPLIEANFTCQTCYDPNVRGVPVEGLSIRLSCRIANTDEILDAIASEHMRNAINAAFNGFTPAVTADIIYGEPSQSGATVVWVIRVTFASELTEEQLIAAQNNFRAVIADQIGTPQENVQVALVVVSSKRDVQDVVYDAVVTISGAAQMIASALMSLVFLALFL